MKTKEIRSMNKEDLKAKLEELKKELIKLNAQISTGTTPKSPGQVKQVKKNIAKILTIINENSKQSSEILSNKFDKKNKDISRIKDSKYPSGIKEKPKEVDKKT